MIAHSGAFGYISHLDSSEKEKKTTTNEAYN